MPNPKSLWIVSTSSEGNPEEQLKELETLIANGNTKLGQPALIEFPDFKTGTLSSLLQLSESLAKHDPSMTSSLSKIVDTLRSLIAPPLIPNPAQANRSTAPLSTHLILDDGRPYINYLLPVGEEISNWVWNRSKYRTDNRSLAEIVDSLVKEVASIDNAQRNKTAAYTVVKGALASASRKKVGNLSSRGLADIVKKEDFAGTNDSEYLETLLVAVQKSAIKEWETSYERLTSMVVPRSSTKLAEDDEFALFGVAIFRKVRDEFAQKCREKKYIVRDFTFDEKAIESAKTELAALEVQEKELWTDLLRLSRINFSETFQVLVHLKIVRAFVESVLRYGLPANYFLAVIRPEPKQSSRLLQTLSQHFNGTISPSAAKVKKEGKKKNADDGGEAPLGEFANVLEGEYLDFVLFEVEPVELLGSNSSN